MATPQISRSRKWTLAITAVCCVIVGGVFLLPLPVLHCVDGESGFLSNPVISELGEFDAEDLVATYTTPEEFGDVFVLKPSTNHSDTQGFINYASLNGWEKVGELQGTVCLRKVRINADSIDSRITIVKNAIVIGYLEESKTSLFFSMYSTRFWREYDAICHSYGGLRGQIEADTK